MSSGGYKQPAQGALRSTIHGMSLVFARVGVPYQHAEVQVEDTAIGKFTPPELGSKAVSTNYVGETVIILCDGLMFPSGKYMLGIQRSSCL